MSVVPSHPSMHPSAELAVSMTKLFHPMFTCDQTETVVAMEAYRRGHIANFFGFTDTHIWGKFTAFRRWFRRTGRHHCGRGCRPKATEDVDG